MADILDASGAPFKAPGLSGLKVLVPGPGTDEEWKDRLAAWADRLGEIRSMDRRRIYEVFGKAKQKSTWIWKQHCDDEDCDEPPTRGRLVHYWTEGVRPHRDVHVLRRRALAEHLRRIPHRPFRFAGIEARRPTAVHYKDGE